MLYFNIHNNNLNKGTNLLQEHDDEVSDFSNTYYRGDCYICQVTHRIHSNFIDNEMPLNDNVVDHLTWYNNYAVI